jgi:hypothetical protein
VQIKGMFDEECSHPIGEVPSRAIDHGDFRAEADGLLGWFTEGFDTLDLKAGKALLDELA